MLKQFAHGISYGRNKTAAVRNELAQIVEPQKFNYADILREGARYPGYSPRIKVQKPPLVLYGIPPLELLKEIDAALPFAKDPRGRKINPSTHFLYSAVFSFPVAREDVEASPELMQEYLAWTNDTLKFAISEWGTYLRSAVAHMDEGHPHIHVYCTPDFSTLGVNLDQIDPGKGSAAEAIPKSKRTKDGWGIKRAGFSDGLRSFQDRYHLAVSQNYGHLRRSPVPQGRRLTAIELNRAAADASLLKVANQKATQIIDDARSTANAIIQAATEKEALFTTKLTQVEQIRQQLAHELDQAKRLVGTLRQWIAWMQEMALAVPTRLKTFLNQANQLLGPKPPNS